MPKVSQIIPNSEANLCPHNCHDGWIPENGNSNAHRCECLLKKIEAHKYENLLKAAQVYEHKDMTFESYSPKHPTQQKALDRMQRQHGSFFLFGPWGTGKTHLLTASVIRAISEGIHAVAISMPHLLREFRKFGRDERLDIEKRAWEIPYLAIDDFGKQRDTDWTDERLFELIDRRYLGYIRGATCTSITSNSTMEDLAIKMDGAILDRIAGMCELLFVDGESYRKLKHIDETHSR